MNRTKTILSLILATLVLFVGVFLYGRYIGKNSALLEQPVVTSQTILDKITDQYFLVTKTIFANSKAEIETPKSNNWTDLFTGKKITVSGLIRIDVGVNIKNLDTENIIVDTRNKLVTINLPAAEILDSSLSGEIDVDVDKSILEKLKGLLNDTRNDDYNLALQTLINTAKTQVIADTIIFTEARTDSMKLVELIVKNILGDYQIIIR